MRFTQILKPKTMVMALLLSLALTLLPLAGLTAQASDPLPGEAPAEEVVVSQEVEEQISPQTPGAQVLVEDPLPGQMAVDAVPIEDPEDQVENSPEEGEGQDAQMPLDPAAGDEEAPKPPEPSPGEGTVEDPQEPLPEDPSQEMSIRDFVLLNHADRSIVLRLSWPAGKDIPEYGDVIILHARLSGYEGLQYSLRWQVQRGEGAAWEDLGSSAESLSFTLDPFNHTWLFRVAVDISGHDVP